MNDEEIHENAPSLWASVDSAQEELRQTTRLKSKEPQSSRLAPEFFTPKVRPQNRAKSR